MKNRKFFKKLNKKDIIVNCKTISEVYYLFRFIRKFDFKYIDGEDLYNEVDLTMYNEYKDKTCYQLSRYKTVVCDYLEFFEDCGYEVLSLDDFIQKCINQITPRRTNTWTANVCLFLNALAVIQNTLLVAFGIVGKERLMLLFLNILAVIGLIIYKNMFVNKMKVC